MIIPEIWRDFLVGYMRSMYNKFTMKEREDLYLRKQSKFYNRGDAEPTDVVSDVDKSEFVKIWGNS